MRCGGGLAEKRLKALDEKQRWLLVYPLQIAAISRRANLNPIVGPFLKVHYNDLLLLLVYARGDDASRALAADAIGARPAPQPIGRRRHQTTAREQWVYARAFLQKDERLLAAALERAAVPLFWKGARALSPIVRRLDLMEVAPETRPSSEGEFALSEVWALIAPEAIPKVVASVMPWLGFEDTARAIVEVAAESSSGQRALADHIDAIVELLEAPNDAAINTGLATLTSAPALTARGMPAVVRGLMRALASVSPGVNQAASDLIGALVEGLAVRRYELRALLEDALFLENSTTLAKVVRNLARFGVLSTRARARVKELGEKEPKKLGKLSQALLKA